MSNFFFLSEINDQIILIQNLDTFHVNESGTDVNSVSMAHPLNEKEQKKMALGFGETQN